MIALDQIKRLWTHPGQADAALLNALRGGTAPAEALGELAHVVGAEEVWLSRLEEHPARSAVWPDATVASIDANIRETHRGFEAYLATLRDAHLDARVNYTNSAGRTFSDPVGDVLLPVALHGQYHRGRINLLLRHAGATPVPADYIAFVRGAPAATNR